jgi:hypothetical protein
MRQTFILPCQKKCSLQNWIPEFRHCVIVNLGIVKSNDKSNLGVVKSNDNQIKSLRGVSRIIYRVSIKYTGVEFKDFQTGLFNNFYIL